jgi:muramoyltetrapeptide carboxypeptidase LdcA involved in peptidoglycan recycling
MTDFAENGGMFPYTVSSLRSTLFESDSIGQIPENQEGWTVERLEWSDLRNQEIKRKTIQPHGWNYLQGSGVRTGHLIGGCLEVLEWLIGTSVWPDSTTWDGAILFLETSEEAPPPKTLARTLRTLAEMGILESLNGILFGRPGGADLPVDRHTQYDEALKEVVLVENGLTDLPIITRMDFGHTDPVFVIPYGVTASIDCDNRSISIDENAVTN